MLCVAMGRMVGATPDGRRAGQPLANSLCPAQGHHPASPTQLLNSVAKLPLDEATGGTSLLVDLPPAAARVRPDGSDPLVALLETFFRRGGTHLEFTLVRPDDLRRAQERPEEFGDLTVRVAGCSARFVDLDRAMQDHLRHIERTAAMAGPAVTRTSPGRRRGEPTHDALHSPPRCTVEGLPSSSSAKGERGGCRARSASLPPAAG